MERLNYQKGVFNSLNLENKLEFRIYTIGVKH